MLENHNEIRKLTSSLIKYFDSNGEWEISMLLKTSNSSIQEIDYDTWNGGTHLYALTFELEIKDYIQYRPFLEAMSSKIKEVVDLFLRVPHNEHLSVVRIVPVLKHYLNWNELAGVATKKVILDKIEHLKNLMVNVSTGGIRIQTVESEYAKDFKFVDECLHKLGVVNPNPYKSLWEWYGRWSQDDLSTYASRRKFVPGIYQPLTDMLMESTEESLIEDYEPTGWDRVDRTVFEMKNRLSSAQTEEQFQVIGMLGRETIITIAQQVFDRELHKMEDDVNPSETDAKRLIDAFLLYELSGQSNERTRKFARSAVDMANHLTHDRMATKRDASMCLISVTAVASLIKIIQENSGPKKT